MACTGQTLPSNFPSPIYNSSCNTWHKTQSVTYISLTIFNIFKSVIASNTQTHKQVLLNASCKSPDRRNIPRVYFRIIQSNKMHLCYTSILIFTVSSTCFELQDSSLGSLVNGRVRSILFHLRLLIPLAYKQIIPYSEVIRKRLEISGI